MARFDENHQNRPSRAGAAPSGTRPSVASLAGASQQQGNSSPLVTRRRFLYGALGVGAVAAVGLGVGMGLNAAAPDAGNGGANSIDCLNAPKSALSTQNDFEAVEDYTTRVQLVGEHDLPYGSLLWVTDDDVAACLLPTDTGSPLSELGLLYLGSGNLVTLRKKAVGASDAYEMYDVRATSEGVVWTEANILQGTWRIYAAPLEGDQLGEPILLEEGDDTYDTPMLTATGKRAFWQVLPKAPNDDGLPARLMGATFGKNDASTVYEATRGMGTPPYGTADSVVVAPRVDASSLYYELVNIDAASGEVRDSLVLPRAVKPLEAGYGTTGFMFSFPDIYELEGAIANLGTYAPRSKPAGGDYNAAQWFDFARTPTAAPAWCGDLLVVKSTYSVCGVDLSKGEYFAIDVQDGADTYGEYLATTGTRDTFVTFTNVNHTPIEGSAIYACRVRVRSPVK